MVTFADRRTEIGGGEQGKDAAEAHVSGREYYVMRESGS